MVREEKWLSGFLIVFSLVFIVLSFDFQPKARVFPLLMGGMTAALLLIDIVVQTGKKKKQQGEIETAQAVAALPEMNEAEADKKEAKYFDMQLLRIILWLAAIIILLNFLSYLYVFPAIVLLFLRFEAKESWRLSVILALSFFLLLYLLFFYILGMNF